MKMFIKVARIKIYKEIIISNGNANAIWKNINVIK